MSSETAAISIRNLGKSYTIVKGALKRTSLAETVSTRLRKPFKRAERETFWALRDLDLDIEVGEVVGFIGRNGAGKSTFLKLLSRITPPTEGSIRLRGRTGSLLEVGTGFHRELTGRENIYLNGAVLGMKRREIDRHFDDIVEFAGVQRFLDTPVKRYSSGMYVRLAFAVAAHLEPEILIVDEVLAVGDAEFQKKCLGKMGEVAREGRTVLFVSHNMTTILNLCNRAVYLEGGRAICDGTPAEVVEQYLEGNRELNRFSPEQGTRGGDKRARIVDFEIDPQPPQSGGPVSFVFHIERPPSHGVLAAELAVGFVTDRGEKILHYYSGHYGKTYRIPPGRSRIQVDVDQFPLTPGRYQTDLWLGAGDHAIDHICTCYRLTVAPGQMNGAVYIDSRGFPVVTPSAWQEVEQASLAEATKP